MLSLQKKSAVLAMAAGLTLGLAACGSNDETVGADSASGTGAAAAAAPSAAPTPAAAIDKLTGKQTAVTLDAGFLAGLTSLKLTPATIGGATLDATTGKLAFPISGGNVTYYDPASGVTPFVQGLINHEGSGLQLTGTNGKVVKLENFVVDPGKSMLTGKVTVDGAVFAPSAPLFFLDGSTVKPLEVQAAQGQAILEGTTVSLTKTAADALNTVFGTTALTEFFKVGIAEITLALPAS
ncbi:MAG: hypothetical protein JWN88_510 [Frankiales bacterium]|jgi:hypothetical protein|nr:hypothetical protein [Frankiales bacterium]